MRLFEGAAAAGAVTQGGMEVDVRFFPLLWIMSCAYPRALNQAADLVENGAHRDALAAYDRALQARPRSDEARQGRLAVLDTAVGEALDEAESHLNRGDWAATLQQVDYALERLPDHSEARALRTDLVSAVTTWIAEAGDEARFEEAYRRAAEARTLLPAESGLEMKRAEIRDHFLLQSDDRLAEGQYRRALEALGPVREHEPDREEQLARLEARVREQWARNVASQADLRVADGQLGPALALRLRALEIAGREVDRAVVGDLRAALHQQGRVSLSVSFGGAADRTARLQSGVRSALAPVGGMVIEPGGVIGASVQARPATCSQGVATFVAEQPYVSGQRQVDNPRFVSLSAELEPLQRAVEADRTREAQLRYDLGVARHQQLIATNDLSPRQAAFHEAESRRSSAEAGVSAAENQLAQAQAQADRVQADPQQHGIAMLVVHHAAGFLQQEQQALAVAMAEVEGLEPGVMQGRARVAASSSAVDRVSQQLHTVAQSRANGEARIEQLTSALAQTPRVLWEDVVDLFRYEVQRVTRKCSGAVDVAVGADVAWSREIPYSTVDDTHAAWPTFGVSHDPLSFPHTDHELIAAGDDELAAQIATAMAEAADRHAAYRVAAACDALSTRPEEALGTLMASILATPAAIDARARAAIEAHLHDAYELVDVSVLIR